MGITAYGEGGKSFFTQQQCAECFAWLPTMPDRWKKDDYIAMVPDPECRICNADYPNPLKVAECGCNVEELREGYSYISGGSKFRKGPMIGPQRTLKARNNAKTPRSAGDSGRRRGPFWF